MKIAIISFHNALNYGAALQAFSLQNVLETYGYDCEYINYVNTHRKGAYNSWTQFKLSWNKGKKKRAIMLIIGAPILSLRRISFNKFYTSCLKKTKKEYHSSIEAQELNEKYDFFIAGSDQIWNPDNNGKDLAYMLDFVKDSSKKISYASSFGTNVIPSDLQRTYAEALKNFSHLSSRELAGVNLIKELTGKEAMQVIDPVFLTSLSKWESITPPIKSKTPFIFMYANTARQTKDFIKKFDKNIQKLHLLSTHIGLHELFNSKIHLCNTMSPYDFLSEIKYSKLVITASFHCLAFAILMKKNFIVLLTGNTGRDERLINLLRITGLSDRILKEKTTYQDLIAPIDYKKVDEILEKEIGNSKKFLQEAILDNKNENKK